MRLDDHDIEGLVRIFAPLSDPQRLRILSRLLVSGEASDAAIERALGLDGGTVSGLLAPLLSAGVVARRVDGSTALYRVIDERLGPLCELVCSGLRHPVHSGTGGRAASRP